jgi:hypothetical protein
MGTHDKGNSVVSDHVHRDRQTGAKTEAKQIVSYFLDAISNEFSEKNNRLMSIRRIFQKKEEKTSPI